MLLPLSSETASLDGVEGGRTLTQSLAQSLSDLFRRHPDQSGQDYFSGPTALDQIPDLAQDVLASARQS